MQHAVALVAALWAAPDATPTTLELRWASAPACVDGPTLLATIDQMVPAGVAGTLELAATPQADKWRVRVDFADVQREVVHSDCVLLTEAVALIVAVRADAVASAVAVQPSVPVQRPSVHAVTAPEPLPVVTPGASAPEAPLRSSKPSAGAPGPTEDNTPRTPLGLRWQGGLRVGADVGTLPRAAAVLAGDLGVRWRSALIESAATATLAPAFRPDAPGVEIGFSLFKGTVRGCYVFEGRNVDMPLCGGVELGGIRARPRELASPNDVNALWFAPVAGVRLQRWVGRAAPLAFFDIAAPVLRHRFEVEERVVHALPPLVLRAGVGLRIGAR